jgi:hypothetical protein
MFGLFNYFFVPSSFTIRASAFTDTLASSCHALAGFQLEALVRFVDLNGTIAV